MKQTYEVEIERDESRYWIATAPGLPGMVTQAKRLEQIAARSREAIAVLLDTSESSFDIESHIRFLDDVPIREARDARARADAAQAEAAEKMQAVVRRLVHEKELTMRDTGQLLGISHQRVEQILQREQRPKARKSQPRKPQSKRQRTPA